MPSGETFGLSKSSLGPASSVRRCAVAVSMIAISVRVSPSGAGTTHPVTTAPASGVSSKDRSSSARPGSGVRSRAMASAASASWPAAAAAATLGDQQPRLLGAEVVVPVPRPPRVMQDGRDPRVRARLPQGSVLLADLVAAEGRGGISEDARRPSRRHPGNAATGRGDPARLTAAGGQQPQGRLGVFGGRLIRAARGGTVRTPGHERRRSVGQERRAALALGAAGEPDRNAARLGIRSPDAGQVFRRGVANGLHGQRHPGAVRRERHRADPRPPCVFVKVAETRHWCSAPGLVISGWPTARAATRPRAAA